MIEFSKHKCKAVPFLVTLFKSILGCETSVWKIDEALKTIDNCNGVY
jgi:hypothetical protein